MGEDDSEGELSLAFSGGELRTLNTLHNEQLSTDPHAQHYFIQPPTPITTNLKRLLAEQFRNSLSLFPSCSQKLIHSI